MSKSVSGITFEGITYKVKCFNLGNEHDLALDVIPVLHLDVIPTPLTGIRSKSYNI